TYVDLDKAAADRQSVALATANGYRRLAGLSPVPSSSVIQKSALAHALYTFFNGALASIRDLGIHKEESTGQGYVGDNVLTRAQHLSPQRPCHDHALPLSRSVGQGPAGHLLAARQRHGKFIRLSRQHAIAAGHHLRP